MALAEHSTLKAPSSSEEGVGGGGVSRDTLLKRAREMRRNPTEPEKRLWMELRNSRLNRFKFRRQAVIGNGIVDFFLLSKGLIIEIDGGTHDADEDAKRDGEMSREFGFSTLRFSNRDVTENLNGVLERVIEVVEETPDRWPNAARHHPQTPSSEEEGA